MPIGILGSLLLCTLIYVGVSAVPGWCLSTLATAKPVVTAIENFPALGWLKVAVEAAIAGLTTVILVMLMGQPRIFYAMSEQGRVAAPLFFGRAYRFRTPH